MSASLAAGDGTGYLDIIDTSGERDGFEDIIMASNAEGDAAADGDLDGDDDDDEYEDLSDIPLNLIDHCADLSYCLASGPDFDKLFPDSSDRSVARDAGPVRLPEGNIDTSLSIPTRPQQYSNDPCESVDINGVPCSETHQCDPFSMPKDATGQPESPKGASFRVGIRKDLTPKEIHTVASDLIRGDTVSLFVDHRQTISQAWMSSLEATKLSSYEDRSPDELIVGSFDEIFRLTNKDRKQQENDRMLLRFTYIHLGRALSIHSNALKEERCRGRFKGQRGHSNASVAIDIYCKVKGNNSKSFKRELSDHIHIGRRWTPLAGTSPLQLAVYSDLAEKVV